MSASLLDKKQFDTYFHQEYFNLREEINCLENSSLVERTGPKAIEDILVKITRLSHEVSDAREHNNAYDQRAYSQAIKALEERLVEAQAKLAPKPKFRFKAKPQNFSSYINEPVGKLQDAELRFNSCNRVSVDSHSPHTSNIDTDHSQVTEHSLGANVEISNYENNHIISPPNLSCGSSFGSITQLKRCIVDTTSLTSKDSFNGLAIADVKSSLILAGKVAGAAYITAVEDSIIVVIARQVRLHDCRDVKIYLHCSSRPIIENCTEVQFSPLPNLFTTTAQELELNHWDQVDDFKWLKSVPSPNWCRLSEEKRLDESTWKEIQIGNIVDLTDCLKKIGIKE